MDQLAGLLLPLTFVVIAFALMLTVTGVIRSKVELVARSFGATETRRVSIFETTVDGLWKGYAVRWRFRRKPRRAVVVIAAAVPSRLLIARGMGFFLKFVGPPAIEMPQYPDFNVRGDDTQLAERLLGDDKIRNLLGSIDRLDVLDLDTGSVRVEAICGLFDDRSALLSDAFELASAVVQRLGLPPAG